MLVVASLIGLCQYYGFPFPLYTSSLHMVVQFLLSSLFLALLPQYRPQLPTIRYYISHIVPCGVSTALDIGLSNASLAYITLSFYTMVKSSVPVFVLIFAFIFRLEQPTWKLVGIMAMISGGVALTVIEETTWSFHVIGATVLGGLRWSLTQLLLSKAETKHPLAVLVLLTPITSVTLFLVAMAAEGITPLIDSPFMSTIPKIAYTLLLQVVGGLLAFMMITTELYLIQKTSVVTLSVAGIVKEIGMILLSHFVFGDDHLNWLNVFGVAFSLTGIALYHRFILSKKHIALPLSRIPEEEEDELELSSLK